MYKNLNICYIQRTVKALTNHDIKTIEERKY